MSHNILYQVGGCSGYNRVETRISETGSGRAGKRQEVGTQIRTGTHGVQPLTLRVLLDLGHYDTARWLTGLMLP